PVPQRGVHGGAEGVVRPRRALRRGRPDQVGESVAAGAGGERAQPGRRRREQPAWHALEAELLGLGDGGHRYQLPPPESPPPPQPPPPPQSPPPPDRPPQSPPPPDQSAPESC